MRIPAIRRLQATGDGLGFEVDPSHQRAGSFPSSGFPTLRIPILSLSLAGALSMAVGPSTLDAADGTPVYEPLAGFVAGPVKPSGPLLGRVDGNYFGVAGGGAHAWEQNDELRFGTVFRMTPAGAIDELAAFTGYNGPTRGGSPSGRLARDGKGWLWGTTEVGGVMNQGVIFKVNETTGVLKAVVDFGDQPWTARGGNPASGLIDDGTGTLWGTTQRGAGGNGTLFKVNPTTGVLTTVVEFTGLSGMAKGRMAFGALASDGAGTLWGTTRQGGASDFGTVFKFNMVSGEFTTVVEFTGTGGAAPGMGPSGDLINDGAGSFWGTAGGDGGSIYGSVFKVNATSGIVTPVVTFTGAGGAAKGGSPVAGLVADGSGFFWGVTAGGYHTTLPGTVFKIAAATGAFTSIAEFTGVAGATKGASPSSTLVSDGAGGLVGPAILGGAENVGTIFRVDPSTGAVTTRAEFTRFTGNPKGGRPQGGLVRDSLGRLWGTTAGYFEKGRNEFLLRVDPTDRTTTAMAEFTDTVGQVRGRRPARDLVSDAAGNLWGTTLYGGGLQPPGAFEGGTVFKVDPLTGVVATVADFTGTGSGSGLSGSKPQSRLVNDGNGNLWGVTSGISGPGLHGGTVFKVNAATGVASTVAVFHFYQAPIGAVPNNLADDGAGFLWGTTQGSNGPNESTVFKVNVATGALTTVRVWSDYPRSQVGRGPLPGFVRDAAGNFWGYTEYGRTQSRNGGIYKFSPSTGQLTAVIDFTGATGPNKGAEPVGRLVPDDAGNFWGQTRRGGVNDLGTVFRINQSSGVLTSLADFTGTTGSTKGKYPKDDLVRDADGNFWGATEFGGGGPGDGRGTVFAITPGGAFSTVLEFAGMGGDSPGQSPNGSLAVLANGDIVGTTLEGGVSSYGGPAGDGQIYRLRRTASRPPLAMDAIVPHLVHRPDGSVTIDAIAQAGYDFQLQRSGDLHSWTPFQTVTAGQNGLLLWLDRRPASDHGNYRIRQLP